MALSEKRRVLRKDVISTSRKLYDFTQAKYVLDSNSSYNVYSQQITRSEGHPWPKAKNVKDIGGPFDTVKLTYESSGNGRVVYDRLYSQFREENDHSIAPRGAGIPAEFQTTAGSLEYYAGWIHNGSASALGPIGTAFINQTIPTNPVVDGAVSLAELFREGIPHMIGSSILKDRVGFMRSLGGEYLNYQFGWKPLVSDVRSAAKAIIESERILTQLARDSGKNVHRKRISQPIKTTRVYTDSANHYAGMSGTDAAAPPWYRETDTTTTIRWFSGCYTYEYEPTRLDTLQRIATQARLLYGLQLDPEVLWNLAPWSWLVDWIANVGPFLGNVSAFQRDGLVLRYGYVMEETTRTLTRLNRVPAKPGFGTWPPVARDEFVGIRKRREKATPYGFGLTQSAFTNRQWAILAALGMTKSGRSLP